MTAGEPTEVLRREVARRLRGDTSAPTVVLRALDARQRPPRWIYSVDVEVPAAVAERALSRSAAELAHAQPAR
jgi:hypothetical protein